ARASDSFSLFSVGGAGDSPAPLGDSPSGTGSTPGCNKEVSVQAVLLPVPSGGSPNGTGESPVLPNDGRPLTPTPPPDGGKGAERRARSRTAHTSDSFSRRRGERFF